MSKSIDGERHSSSETTTELCRLCSALRNEIKKAHTCGENEREKLLNILLSGHTKTCHCEEVKYDAAS